MRKKVEENNLEIKKDNKKEDNKVEKNIAKESISNKEEKQNTSFNEETKTDAIKKDESDLTKNSISLEKENEISDIKEVKKNKKEKKEKVAKPDIGEKPWKILFFITLGVAGVFLILLIVLLILLNNPPTNIF